jgi:hypothetical protein
MKKGSPYGVFPDFGSQVPYPGHLICKQVSPVICWREKILPVLFTHVNGQVRAHWLRGDDFLLCFNKGVMMKKEAC